VPRRRRRLAVVGGLAAAWLAVVAVVAVGLPRGGPDRRAASQNPAPTSTFEVLAPGTGEPGTSTAPTPSPTTAAPTTTLAATPTAPSGTPPGTGRVGVPARRVVPSVLGLHRGQAVDALDRAGLRVRLVEVRTSGPGQVQRVVAQDPPAGDAVPAGSVVTVAVGTKGPT
jgi:hypothetical protein